MTAPWKQKAGKGKAEYDQPPPGNHPAVCVAIVDLGTQKNNYQGTITKQRRAMFVWELTTERDTNFPMGDRNFLVGIDLTLSCNEKAKLRLWVEARKNKTMPDDLEYDYSLELGQPCLLSVARNDNGYAKVTGMSAVPKGMTVPPAKLKPFIWSLDDLPEDGSEPKLPDWLPRLYGKTLADVIAGCEELNSDEEVTIDGPKSADAADGTPDQEDDIPF